MLADCTAHSAALPRLALLYDLPLLLSSAAALPVLWQCGLITVYQCTDQCGERSNAAFGRQSAAVLPSLAPHDSKARLRDVTICRRFMAKPCTPHPIAQRMQLFKLQTGNVGGRGETPLAFLWGIQRGVFSSEREYPPLPRPHTVWGQKQRCRAAPPVPYGRKKKQPSRAAFLPRPRRESCPNCQYGILIPISPLFSLDNMRY